MQRSDYHPYVDAFGINRAIHFQDPLVTIHWASRFIDYYFCERVLC